MNVVDVWRGKSTATQPYYYWEFHEGGFAQAIRKGNWKCIKLKTGQMQLFDLSKDLGEATDLAPANPTVVAELKGLMQKVRTENPDWPITA